ncbi:2-oxoglutarate dehydrogenase complex dihydrolipoyllysine-residue succinyltransferase [Geoalkalibacter sp.]|uniref:2-oxoglutarate dehydrogenase complex dihydrolipoyllysine-residue succinyltransferase n=1 Tax=Geoalkalibacter sp. TaxID=3041440 RepID=UPI00272DC8CF|nr:2-oxoglutarate dehydrogenase complex dihydrolipoyllysine-residue succinyltransferase [Geoalkalibacter sp.]
MEIKVPEVGESVFEAQIAQWHKKDGEKVREGDLLCELETDKVSLELNADGDGILRIGAKEGETVKVGAVIGTIEESEEAASGESEPKEEPKREEGKKEEQPAAKAALAPAPEKTRAEKAEPEKAETKVTREQPRAEAAAAESAEKPAASAKTKDDERVTRRPMSPIRKRIAERLLAARQQTAMLTTFNEADMSRVLALRQKHQESFVKRHGVKLGLMSFFVKASVEALKEFPEVNAQIDGDDLVYHHYYDIGIAVGAEKGLVVPVLRGCEGLSFAEIEQQLAAYVEKIKNNKLALADLEGGTFTITNGGVYGSINSTPILNPPQSAVLGLHAIQERPVARAGEILIRPMMNLALSYDHRIIDGRQAVGFLKRIKDLVEEPEEMLLEM